MKRSGPPTRRKPLRSKPLTRTDRERRAEARTIVFRRDRWTCLLHDYPEAGPCIGHLTPHHLWKDGQGGPYTPDNLVTICAGHNSGWIEENPLAAHRIGLVVRCGDSIASAWARLVLHGLAPGIMLTDDLPTDPRIC